MENKEKNVIVIDKNYDRAIFLFYKDNEVVGINFHQCIDRIDMSFNEPNPHIFELYRRLSKSTTLTEEEKIDEAIDIYVEAFIFNALRFNN